MTPIASARGRAPHLLALMAAVTLALAGAAFAQTSANVTIKDFDFSPMAVSCSS